MNQKYGPEDWRKIDPLFSNMSVKAIADLDWVRMSNFTLCARRKQLGIPAYKPPKPSPKLSTGQIDHYIRNMGGVMHNG